MTIDGQPASKANRRRIVRHGDTTRVIKSKEALVYERCVALDVPPLKTLMGGPLRADIHVWYRSERPDLDVSLILDLLQGRIYHNDRQIREQHLYHHIDRAEPRATIFLQSLVTETFPFDEVEL